MFGRRRSDPSPFAGVPSMETFRDIGAPAPFLDIYAERNDRVRLVSRTAFAARYICLFANQQNGTLPTGSRLAPVSANDAQALDRIPAPQISPDVHLRSLGTPRPGASAATVQSWQEMAPGAIAVDPGYGVPYYFGASPNMLGGDN